MLKIPSKGQADLRAKQAEDRPRTEEARVRNDGIRNDLFDLRSEQMKLSHEVEELKAQRQSIMEQAVSCFHLYYLVTNYRQAGTTTFPP